MPLGALKMSAWPSQLPVHGKSLSNSMCHLSSTGALQETMYYNQFPQAIKNKSPLQPVLQL